MKTISFLLGVIILLLVYLCKIVSTQLTPIADIKWNNCMEDETLGYIPPGSCSCAKELFPKFEESYDWIDACYVLYH